jgi:hypothetical protein
MLTVDLPSPFDSRVRRAESRVLKINCSTIAKVLAGVGKVDNVGPTARRT